MEANNTNDAETGRYGVPVKDIERYVARAISELHLDPAFINDMDSAMYAWRLSYNDGNLKIARACLNMPSASLSEIARAMANNEEACSKIEGNSEYTLPPMRTTHNSYK